MGKRKEPISQAYLSSAGTGWAAEGHHITCGAAGKKARPGQGQGESESKADHGGAAARACVCNKAAKNDGGRWWVGRERQSISKLSLRPRHASHVRIRRKLIRRVEAAWYM